MLIRARSSFSCRIKEKGKYFRKFLKEDINILAGRFNFRVGEGANEKSK